MPNPKDPSPADGRAAPSAGLVELSHADVEWLADGNTALAHVLRRVVSETRTPGTEPRAPFESALQ